MENSADWLTKLRQHKQKLSPAESKVARVALESPSAVMGMSITELAELAGVGEATVSRLVRHLGFPSYHAFKITIAQTLAPAQAMRSPLAAMEGDHPAWASESAELVSHAVTETLHLVDEEAFSRTVERILNADRVEFYGSGMSGITATMAQQRFLAMGIIGTAFVDPHSQLLSASSLTKKSIAIGISYSGSTMDVNESLGVAKKRGAHIVCITAASRSPLSSIADDILLAGGGSEALVSNLFHQIPVMFLLEMLAQRCAQKAGEVSRKIESQAGEAIARRIY